MLDADGHKEQAKRQAALAKQTQEAQRATDENAINPHVDSVLTTDDHVGKVAPEPDKSQDMEAAKTDQADRTGVDSVRTRTRTTPGKGATDEVVTDPPTGVTTGATTGIQSEADKNRDAIKGGKENAKASKAVKKASKATRKASKARR